MEQRTAGGAAFSQRRARAAGTRRFLDQAAEILRATGVMENARRPGDAAPALTLHAAGGGRMALADAWRQGPVVVVFYRGDWCSLCVRQLRTWQAQAATLRQLGASLVAISPESPGQLRHTIGANALTYPVLSDEALAAANGFNVSLRLPPELVDLYAYVGADPAILDGNGQWELPVPATFVVGRDGQIAFARVELDDRKRTGPGEVIPAIRALLADRLPDGCLPRQDQTKRSSTQDQCQLSPGSTDCLMSPQRSIAWTGFCDSMQPFSRD